MRVIRLAPSLNEKKEMQIITAKVLNIYVVWDRFFRVMTSIWYVVIELRFNEI